MTLSELSIDHTVEVEALTGIARLTVPLSMSPGRSMFTPDLALVHATPGRNSPFGVGWGLAGLPAIGLDTRRGLPDYSPTTDRYLYAGGDRLVPYRTRQGASWPAVISQHGNFTIERFRPAVERSFERFEKWTRRTTGRTHWVVRARNGVISLFGQAADNSTRIADPADPDRRVFQWLLEAQYDPKGNAIVYQYKKENADGVDTTSAFESPRARTGDAPSQRYIKRILYGNSTPMGHRALVDPANEWRFEAVFDYGEHAQAAVPTPGEVLDDAIWDVRLDPFSTCLPGFDLRTYRLCRRVLMFHRFPELGATPCLVNAFELSYDEHPAGSMLRQIRRRGYRRDLTSGVSEDRAVPPLTMVYGTNEPARSFEVCDGVTDLPSGLSGREYQWVDLRNEGVPGFLHRNQGCWYYKENLGEGRFGPLVAVDELPAAISESFEFDDLEGDGNLHLVSIEGREAGHFRRDRATHEWEGFRSLNGLPRIDLVNARVQRIDLNGDGHADLLIDHLDRLVWYPSLGADGFAEPRELTKPDAGAGGAPTLTQDSRMRTFFLDMTGDGALDFVRVDNGRVEYWPHLGDGKFGAGIVMEGAPQIDGFYEMDGARIRFVDLDGSGTADLLYIGNGEVRCWSNQSGNSFGPMVRIAGLPYIDRASAVHILDFLGDGGRCVVWSTPLASHEGHAISYLRLCSSTPSRALLSVSNGVGREARLEYRSSAREYLRDKSSMEPWQTLMPYHHSVVTRFEGFDRVLGASMVTRYQYRDGYFDDRERRFGGFGLVTSFDSDAIQAAGAAAIEESAPPAVVRSWHHTGAPLDPGLSGLFYRGDASAAHVGVPRVEATTELTTAEQMDADRALAGMPIRQEIYSTRPDGTRETHPLRTVEFGYRVRHLQSSPDRSQPVYTFAQCELLSYEYEGDATDPRVAHEFVLHTDDFGNVNTRLSLGYPRRPVGPAPNPEQSDLFAELHLRQHVNFDDADRFEVGIEQQDRRYELTGLVRPAAGVFRWSDVAGQCATALANTIDFHEVAAGSSPQARLLAWNRNVYWDDQLTAALPGGRVGSTTLLHHVERAMLPESAVAGSFGGRITGQMLTVEGRYLSADGHWWAEATTYRYAERPRFHRLIQESDPGGSRQVFAFDAHDLLVVSIDDAFGNRIESTPDYQVLASSAVVDANGNVNEALYDPLGVAFVVSARGRQLGADGQPHPVGSEPLSKYVHRGDHAVGDVLADPARFVQGASRFTMHDPEAFQRGDGPPCTLVLEREQLVYDGEGGGPVATGRIAMAITYSDGFSRPVQTKRRVDGGPAIQRGANGAVVVGAGGEPMLSVAAARWLTSGHDVINNKGWIVRSYEPLFSTVPAFEADAELRSYGVATLTRYDAVGRVIRRDLPNGTVVTNMYSSWCTHHSDAVDNVVGSAYETARSALPPGDPERNALTMAQALARTPTIVEIDVLGRTTTLRETGPGGVERVTVTKLGARGLTEQVTDPRGLVMFTYRHDMLGRVLSEDSPDSGQRWNLYDVHGRLIRRWDGRGADFEHAYDVNGRRTSTRLRRPNGFDAVIERTVYGDNPLVEQADLRNVRGRVIEQYDNAGLLTHELYHLDGQVRSSGRRLRDAPDAHRIIADWSTLGAVSLGGTVHRTETHYDALGRPASRFLPDGTTRDYDYTAAGHLGEVRLTTADGQLNQSVIATAIQANARGQRTLVHLGNGMETSYDFDAEMFRLTHFATQMSTGTGSRTYLDVDITYDPVGNVTRLVDHAQEPAAPTPLIQGLSTSSASEYTYDAFYQLVEATGRVHQGLLQHDYRSGLSAPDAIKGTRHLSLNNGAAVERYRRTYGYDLAGNITRIQHLGATNSWTTDMSVSPTSNRSVPSRGLDGTPTVNPELSFDANGNTTVMPHLRWMEWDHDNNLTRAVIIDRTATGEPDDAEYYVYGADGRRVRRITERLVTGQVTTTEITYLDGCEIKRIRRGNNTSLLRQTSHVADGSLRLATIYQWTVDQTGLETSTVGTPIVHYVVGNHLGSISLELDDAGGLITYEEYFPYGGTSFIAGRSARDSRLKDNRYSGQICDDATGFYCYDFRYYAPFIGGWLSPDPIGPADGFNLYRFVRNNPITFVDFNGLQTDFAHPVVGFKRQKSVPTKRPLPLTQRTEAAYKEVSEYVSKERIKGAVVWNPAEGNWSVLDGPLPEGVLTGADLFPVGGSEGSGSKPGIGQGHGKESKGTAKDKPGEGDGDNTGTADGSGGEGAKRTEAKKDEKRGTGGSGEKGSEDGKSPGGGQPDGAQPSKEGKSDDKGPSTKASGSHEEEGGADPGNDTDPGTTGAFGGDPRGEPGAEGGSGVRPDGVSGSTAGATDPGGSGDAGRSPEGREGGEPEGERGGLRGGTGWLTLPTWLADPLNDIADVAAAVVDHVQVGLDIIGLIPGLGEIADGLNGLISLARGDYAGAALSFAAMIPLAGWAATAGKFGRRAVKAASQAGDVAAVITKYGDEAASLVTTATKHVDEAAQIATKSADELASAANEGRTLYRGMTETAMGTPQVGSSARQLGVRSGPGPGTDIPVVGGSVKPGTGGMSVSPDTPANLPPHRRPPELGGTGKDPVWKIEESELGTELRFNQDSPTHGLIEPAYEMTLDAYNNALASLQSLWKKL
ncbi:SpvB/TcaC N-terminal domain-containing protein [Nakamurella sp. GG22]